ncbi:MAG: LamG domain-containing protein [Candidatus Poribacteria bacterium]|nr:LamG domain-containing protein [Candidatus Poribacteria bacterium]
MRKLALILGIVCSIAWLLPHISSAKIDPDTAVGVWLFDEGSGKTTKDSSGKGNDGEINGAKWKDGKFGDGLEFDGAHWVSIESTPDLQLGDKHTMMAWFFATNIASWRQLIAKNNEYLLRIDPPGEGNKMSSFVHLGGWEPRASASVPDTDTWIHFAATYDSSENNNQLVVYVNGVRAGASTRPGKGTGNADPVTIGRWNNGSYFFGIIDEVAIFKDVLTEDDLKTIMDNGLDKALGGVAAVDASEKLTTTWANLKSDR